MAAPQTLNQDEPPANQLNLAPDPNLAPPDDYVFGLPATQAPAPLTQDDLTAAVQRALQGNQRVYEDPEDNELAQVAALQFADPVAAEKKRKEIYARSQAAQFSQMQTQVAESMAPVVRTQITDNLTKGLGEAARQHVADYLERYNAQGLAGIARDKATQDMLRHSAQDIHRTKNGTSVTAPTSESTATTSQNLDPEMERQIEVMWSQFKSIPGMTKDALRKKLLEGV